MFVVYLLVLYFLSHFFCLSLWHGWAKFHFRRDTVIRPPLLFIHSRGIVGLGDSGVWNGALWKGNKCGRLGHKAGAVYFAPSPSTATYYTYPPTNLTRTHLSTNLPTCPFPYLPVEVHTCLPFYLHNCQFCPNCIVQTVSTTSDTIKKDQQNEMLMCSLICSLTREELVSRGHVWIHWTCYVIQKSDQIKLD